MFKQKKIRILHFKTSVPTFLVLRTIHISDLRYIQKNVAVKILSEFPSWLKLLIMLEAYKLQVNCSTPQIHRGS